MNTKSEYIDLFEVLIERGAASVAKKEQALEMQLAVAKSFLSSALTEVTAQRNRFCDEADRLWSDRGASRVELRKTLCHLALVKAEFEILTEGPTKQESTNKDAKKNVADVKFKPKGVPAGITKI